MLFSARVVFFLFIGAIFFCAIKKYVYLIGRFFLSYFYVVNGGLQVYIPMGITFLLKMANGVV
jgi:hypothetical protein